MRQGILWVCLLLTLMGGAAMSQAAADKVTDFAGRHLTWYGQSEFKISSEAGEILYIDAQRLPEQHQPADLILVTHEHYDHYNEKVIGDLKKSGAAVIVPDSMAKAGYKSLSVGQTIQIGSFKITGVRAYNLTKTFHPKSKNWLGYLIEVDGIKIYHAGDTDNIPEMKEIQTDIALLPIGGTYTMNVEEAAAATEIIRAKLYIPMHFGSVVGKKEDGQKFIELVKKPTMLLTAVK
jgi:L-ascorbate metabolism protein UlaG (beta-lactamase superfamily)